MNSRAASLRVPFPLVLRHTDVRSYLLTTLFVLLGAACFPIHLFAIAAGPAFGGRACMGCPGITLPLILLPLAFWLAARYRAREQVR
ncbi:MAG: hypothetical protein WC369_08255 [Dehalococcoidales bacterium]|jgi:hypothetical protein